ncbi:SWI/SNF complex subunit Snf5 [Schizosaccharomyces cryophilus OY26]|uniref:SWI/SNF complex subunit Snf5 n=1 Tax=Schizosaccharomyces cryophilus (strain OY26 / ATCC MYA-4695 / CBS 11777 / NBRC 106824 / NRRL Y48691) TaxID=653667 RepID=S9W284_SCHCR|nr:SWI/SNF complex subunit Snf5 [Schizosaccharomyces cryophilus OY26]EPY54153.1 SWI/SNF complex subunit Snf5 [Schizosaccharomyces cryophilus OY26]
MDANLQHCLLSDQAYLSQVSENQLETSISNTTLSRYQSARELLSLRSGSEAAINRFGIGYAGFGNGWTSTKSKIIYPNHKKKVRGRYCYSFNRRTNATQAELPVDLVPIRLEIDADRYKLRESFTWNAYDKCIPLDVFAEQLCLDYDIPPNHMHMAQNISKSIQSQIQDYRPIRQALDSSLQAQLDDQGRRLSFSEEGISVDESPQISKEETKNDGRDLRFLVNIDITIGRLNLIDQFEWDLFSPSGSAEEFASVMCFDLGLSGDFCTSIAHSIREQSQMYLKSLVLVGYTFDEKEIDDEEIRSFMLPPLRKALRQKDMSAKPCSPMVYELSDAEMERQDRGYDREARRMRRRQGRAKHGVTLPDLNDIPKIHRTSYNNSSVPFDDDWNQMYADAIARKQATLDYQASMAPMKEGLVLRFKISPEKLKLSVDRAMSSPKLTPSLLTEVYSANVPQFGYPSIQHEVSDNYTVNPYSNTSLSLLNSSQIPMNAQAHGNPLPNFAPDWVKRCIDEINYKYPNEKFAITVKQAENPAEQIFVRIRCQYCLNEIFSAGPGLSFGNFEIHLLSKAHQLNKESQILL